MEYLNTEKVIAIGAGGIAIIGKTYAYLFYFLIIGLLKNWSIFPLIIFHTKKNKMYPY